MIFLSTFTVSLSNFFCKLEVISKYFIWNIRALKEMHKMIIAVSWRVKVSLSVCVHFKFYYLGVAAVMLSKYILTNYPYAHAHMGANTLQKCEGNSRPAPPPLNVCREAPSICLFENGEKIILKLNCLVNPSIICKKVMSWSWKPTSLLSSSFSWPGCKK